MGIPVVWSRHEFSTTAIYYWHTLFYTHTDIHIACIYIYLLFECFFCFPFLSAYKMNKIYSIFLFQAFWSGAYCGGRLWRHEHEVQGCCCGKEDRQIHHTLQHERFDLYQQPNWWFVANSDNRGTEYWFAFRVLNYWCQQKSVVSKP